MDNVFSTHVQDCAIRLMITDTEFLKLIYGNLFPEMMTSEVAETAVRVCCDYFANFKCSPNQHFQEEFDRLTSSLPEEKRERYREYGARVMEMPKPDSRYISKRINEYIKAREFSSALEEAASFVEKGEFDRASHRMHLAMKAGIDRENVGLDYTRDESTLRSRRSPDETLMPFGIEWFDSKLSGMHRGQLVTLIGSYKGSKSWMLCHFARIGLTHGKNVVYLSHENSEEEFARRFDMMFNAFVSTPEPKEIFYSYPDGDERSYEIKREAVPELRDTIYNDEKVLRKRRYVERMGGRSRLFVKKYPMATCSVFEAERYMDYLERYHNVTTDILITDYADIMKPTDNRMDTRDRLNDTYIHLKRIADERNILVITASQCKREAINAKTLSIKDFAEDIRKAANVDIALGITSTPQLKEAEAATVQVLAHRSEEQGLAAIVGQKLDTGGVVLWSMPAAGNRTPGASSNVDDD